ncbi:MAG: glutaredoxin domain-containing protein, partial [Glaciecola sp.]|nr:glutaredoxin domain-containing protein [Glaciecola sp.]
MANVELYTKDYCPFCRRAVALLTQKGVDFSNTDILDHPAQREVMITRANG